MRRGELLGLKWENANFAARTLRIGNIIYSPDHGIYETTPKTEKSRRTIALPSETVGLPREYRIWQNTERLRLGPAKALKNTTHKTKKTRKRLVSWAFRCVYHTKKMPAACLALKKPVFMRV